ncbi:Zinc metalloproteinase nas-10 [Caenorhabditis elegans]|uniref:Zinc metalloproteinase nas-10 n=1 Tax=Caenorhabditis elegans TaxID=6239 RepID=NAS10_CAEEL|nr:Zinc metalloproteinase nas-10 [Caenorhabditis elegans]Q21388.2 RecName: Full=Zinc metalloproteinase nas-10; AltName: Full=Nematode astacin 10; Flags: Precursor [Caenorhabditis elegans]CAR81375.1 Zinc metalloproteinase nas-10 [Caenorhabditis elegans]|eukprot:NP_001257126.1 Metalloendopeptidase [Caenorhabditis elegans]
MLSSKLFCVLFFCLGLSNGWPQFDFMNQMGFGGGFNNGPHPNSRPGSRPNSPLGDIFGNINGMVKGITDQIGKIAQGLDVNNDLGKMAHGPPPPQSEWVEHARRFCRRFPGHPKCRGQLPQFNDIGSMLNGILVDSGKWLPKVPFINIRDPLSGINSDLKNALNGIQVQFGQISQQFANNIRNICQQMNCKQQQQKNVQMKQAILKQTVDFEKKVFGNNVADKMNLRFDRTLQLKQALLEKAQLKGVVAPEDNGVFDKDLLLTETQANFMLNELGKGGEGAIPMPGSAKAKRASIFFEQNLIQKWPSTSPIPYTFDSSLDNLDQNDVRGAISEIEQKTCIRFKYFASPPKGNHINYQKVNSPSFCGLSYIGRVEPANPVYLSFQCGNGRGIAVHETMHALGVNHQHLRMDRDKHIKVDWSNINPQQYDAFVVADSKLYTTYGVKYAYDSIMHYNAYTGAVNIAKPTMIPLVNQQANIGLLGQRAKMSNADVEILNKMYCKSAGCDDKNVYCGAWALQDLCNNPNHNVWMRSNCRKSCNFC